MFALVGTHPGDYFCRVFATREEAERFGIEHLKKTFPDDLTPEDLTETDFGVLVSSLDQRGYWDSTQTWFVCKVTSSVETKTNQHPDRRAFFTGSRVYGTPRPDSDYDLVVLVEDFDTDHLLAGIGGAGLTSSGIVSSLFGDQTDCVSFRWGFWSRCTVLDLIVIHDPGMFDVWKAATEFMKERRPVTREKAIDYLNKKRARYYASRDWKGNTPISDETPNTVRNAQQLQHRAKTKIEDASKSAHKEWFELQEALKAEAITGPRLDDEIPF